MDLPQVIRWQAGFVRGLAQSVLDRAKVIRSSLPQPFAGAEEAAPSVKAKKAAGSKKRVPRKSTPKKSSLKAKKAKPLK